MFQNYLTQDVAFKVQQDNERKIAAAELRRVAKAARHAEGSSTRAQRDIAARLPLIPAIDLVASACRSLVRGLVVVGRRALAGAAGPLVPSAADAARECA